MRGALGRKSFSIELVADHYHARQKSPLPLGKYAYRMVLPPPNVTGDLHLGHALTVVVEDSMCRYQRRLGRNVEWLPGFDHAGIATQTVVERRLYNEKGLRRVDLKPEEFLDACNTWKNSRVASITEQLRMTGASLDWEKAYYTMDETFSPAVAHAFCRLNSEGLIFRDRRLINWCPTLQSAISDQEVDFLQFSEPAQLTLPSGQGKVEVGVLHRVRYALEGGVDGEYLEVATTRPETVFADMALAVHPNDDRFARFVGQRVIHPLTGKLIPVIADSAVLIDKGTGVLKVTPAHDFLDYAIAKRHPEVFSLPYDSCIDDSSCIVNGPPEYNGLSRFEAKRKVLEHLESIGAYGGRLAQGSFQIPVCSRSGDVIEPLLRDQWFLQCDGINGRVLEFLERGKLQVFPRGNEQKLIDWLNYSEPWCLSRQLVWGHRIPAYEIGPDSWKVSEIPIQDTNRDPDVLDTWFSSALIPIVTQGWPSNPIKSIPVSVMETGHDIIGFWVARMLSLCTHLSGHLPFDRVLLHGLVRDSTGRKMSKSLGNVVDPLDVISGISLDRMLDRVGNSSLDEKEKSHAIKDLKTRFPNGMSPSGTDGLRFSLLRHDLLTENINVSIETFANEGLRFCNKLWNLSKYADGVFDKVGGRPSHQRSQQVVDIWILSRLQSTVRKVYELMDADDDCGEACPHLAFGVVRDFILHDLCDVYLETTKSAINATEDTESIKTRQKEVADTLYKAMPLSLALAEPFIPFVTTFLGDQLPDIDFDAVKLNPTATGIELRPDVEQAVAVSLAITGAVRSLRIMLDIPKRLRLVGFTSVEGPQLTSRPIPDVLGTLTNLELRDSVQIPSSAVPVAVPGYNIRFAVQIDPSHIPEVLQRMEQLLARAQAKVEQLEATAVKAEDNLVLLRENDKTRPTAMNKATRRHAQVTKALHAAHEEVVRLEKLVADFFQD